MSRSPCPPLLAWIVIGALVTGCSKHDTEQAAPTGAASQGTQPSTTPSSTSGAATQAADLRPEEPIPQMTDPGARPGVWLSINGEASPSIPQGAAIIIRATALSARNKPLEFKPDGVQLAITDVGGKAVTWPLKRAAAAAAPAAGQAVSQPTAAAAKAMNGGTVTWVLMDSGSIPPGDYRLAATLPTAMSYPAQLKVVPPLASPTDAQKAQRFLTDARAALALGDPQRALGAAEQRLKTSPRDIPALRIKADALAAMGRTKDAALAYTQALGQFTAQNPKAPEPPLELIRSYQSLEAGK